MRKRHYIAILSFLYLIAMVGGGSTRIGKNAIALMSANAALTDDLHQDQPIIIEKVDTGQILERGGVTDYCFAGENQLVVSRLDPNRYTTRDGYPTSEIRLFRLPSFNSANDWFFPDCVTRVSASWDGHWIATASLKNRPDEPTGEIQLWDGNAKKLVGGIRSQFRHGSRKKGEI